MNPEIKTQWVAALRSGEYRQTRVRLQRIASGYDRAGELAPIGFCCLGVLCDLHSKATGRKWAPSSETGAEGTMEYAGCVSVLPNVVMDWAWLDSQNPIVYGCNQALAELNDNGRTFNEIADIIEREL